jgi:hypothetical protein
MLAEQGGGEVLMEIYRAVREIKIAQQCTIDAHDMYGRRRVLRDKEEDVSAREDVRRSSRTSRMKMEELSHMLEMLPTEIKAKGDPEAMCEFLMNSGHFRDRMVELFGSPMGAIEAMHYLKRKDILLDRER